MNIFDLEFQLTNNASGDLQPMILGSQFTFPNGSPGSGSLITNFRLNDIRVPDIFITPITSGNYQSKNGEHFSRFEIVDRYYDITPSAGIIDMFTLNMQLENDVNLLLIEAIDPSTGNSLKTILNDELSGGSNYSIVFHYDEPLVVPIFNFNGILDAPQSLPINNVKVPIEDCLPPTEYVMYHEGANFNTIRIHERLKIMKVLNCDNNTSSSTEYNIGVNCSKNTAVAVCNSNTVTLDAICEKVQPLITTRIVQLNSAGTEYESLSNNSIASCDDALPSNDLTILIRNTASVPVNFPSKVATARLLNIEIYFNNTLFEYDQIWFGNRLLTTNEITSAPGLITLDIDDITQDPNPTSHLFGVEGDYNNYLGTNKFSFLPPDHTIGVTFKGLRIIDCTDPNYNLKNINHNDLVIIGVVNVIYEDMCDFDNNTYHNAQDNVGSSLSNRYSGNLTGVAKPMDVTTVATQSTLTFTFVETSNNLGIYFQGQLFPWRIFNKYSLGTQFFPEPNYIDIINCNLRYYARVEFPVVVNASYTILSAFVIDNKATNPVQIPVNFSVPDISKPNEFDIDFTNSFTPFSPDVTIIVNIELDCSSAGYGFDDIDLELRSECNSLDCGSCNYITYGKSKVTLYRHCYGVVHL
ncbi:MAG: hypothetical protein IPK10_15310 [Bacteroidetes bacterium]|nr:hypothetical protein [Bacteroidota bacterium]